MCPLANLALRSICSAVIAASGTAAASSNEKLRGFSAVTVPYDKQYSAAVP